MISYDKTDLHSIINSCVSINEYIKNINNKAYELLHYYNNYNVSGETLGCNLHHIYITAYKIRMIVLNSYTSVWYHDIDKLIEYDNILYTTDIIRQYVLQIKKLYSGNNHYTSRTKLIDNLTSICKTTSTIENSTSKIIESITEVTNK